MPSELPTPRSAFRHTIEIPVQWGDMDALGHVNNVAFLRWSESGRITYLDRVLGGDRQIWGILGPILAHIGCQFLQQLHYPADLEVATRTARIGGKSLTTETAIYRRGEDAPAAVATATLAWFDYKRQCSVTVPDDVRAAITAFEPRYPTE